MTLNRSIIRAGGVCALYRVVTQLDTTYHAWCVDER